MAGRECYHCKQWVEDGEAHDCWTTTEGALTADLVPAGSKHLSTREMGDAVLEHLSGDLASKGAHAVGS